MLSGQQIAPIDVEIAALIDESFSPQARSAALAALARETLVAAQRQNGEALGEVPPHATIVDGIDGASEDAVRPDGRIDYAFQLVGDVIDWIRAQLMAHSPVSSSDAHPGLYKSSHVLLADGEEVAPGAAVPPAARYVFFNTQPYARAIERGESAQAPTGVYEAIAVLAGQQFGNQANVAFTFISAADGGIAQWAQTAGARDLARRARGGRRELHDDWLTRVPAIVVTPLG